MLLPIPAFLIISLTAVKLFTYVTHIADVMLALLFSCCWRSRLTHSIKHCAPLLSSILLSSVIFFIVPRPQFTLFLSFHTHTIGVTPSNFVCAWQREIGWERKRACIIQAAKAEACLCQRGELVQNSLGSPLSALLSLQLSPRKANLPEFSWCFHHVEEMNHLIKQCVILPLSLN